jgi:Lipocalin-like domain
MNRRRAFTLRAITVLGLVLLPGAAFSQQQSLKQRIVGTWIYVSSTAKQPNGSPLWGNDPKGLFILTDNGHFSWQIFRSDRPKFALNDRLHAAADECSADLQGSLAYFGTYTINETDNIITFKTEGSTFPNSEGEVLRRFITNLTSDELRYTNPSTTLGVRVEAVWKRVN